MTRNPRTQKAKGINELEWNGFHFLDKYVGANPVESDIYEAANLSIGQCRDFSYPVFARPCPLLPRHGFVESKVITNPEALFDLRYKAYDADPQSEIVVSRYIKASYSAILQEGRLTIGPGHDGATSGRNSVSVYLRGDGHLKEHAICLRSGVKESPYIELVYDSRIVPHAVQLRDGPRLPQSIDNVPETMTVKHVLTVGPDAEGVMPNLLEWERLIKTTDRGTVVYHPGGTLSSHYSIHAVVAGIPVMISRKPSVGERLEKTKDAEVPCINWPDLKSAFIEAMTADIEMAEAMRFVLAVNKVIKSPSSYLQGYAMGLAYRLSLTACEGEKRHLPKMRRERDQIYHSFWKNAAKRKGRIVKLYESFMDDVWFPGFGGIAWASIAHAGYSMYQAIVDENVEDTLFEFNKLVDAHHNNAWFGKKFMAEIEFFRASEGYYGTAVKSAKLLYSLLAEKRPKHVWKWKALKPLRSFGFNRVRKSVLLAADGWEA